jgi:hypothetical protein
MSGVNSIYRALEDASVLRWESGSYEHVAHKQVGVNWEIWCKQNVPKFERRIGRPESHHLIGDRLDDGKRHLALADGIALLILAGLDRGEEEILPRVLLQAE